MTFGLRGIHKTAGLPGRLPLTAGGGRGMLAGAGSQTSNNQAAAIAAYGSVGVLFGVTNRIAEATALVDWNLYEQQPNGERTLLDDATAPAQHEATALWTHPNPWFTRQEFVQTFQQHLDLCGESYWLICQAGKPASNRPVSGMRAGIELWPIRPDRIRPWSDGDNYISGYMYKNGAEVVPLPPEAIVHLRVPNPADPFTGFGPVQSMMADLNAEKFAAQWNANFFINSAEPGGIIQFDTPLSDVDFERLVTRWREQHQGVANAHRVAILERGTWVDRKYTQRDMQWQQLRHVNRDNVLLPFGMHGAIMGISENVNKANAEAAELTFARWVVRPRLVRIKDALNEHVLPFIDGGLTMDFVDPSSATVSEQIFQAQALYIARLATLNEARDMVGLSAVEGANGDAFLDVAAAPPVPSTPPARPSTAALGESVTKVLAEAEAAMASGWGRRMREVEEEWEAAMAAGG